MKITKQTFITSFALFSLFFGAGNLIFPAFLGYNAGDGWFMVAVGFVLSAVVIPILAIYGHARLQGTMMDFGKKVSPTFAFIYSLIVYVISVSFPSPRTASVTYEMAVQPYIDIPSWGLSTIYFILVLIFVLNRSKIIDIIGKFLTPGILIILGSIICIGLFGTYDPMHASTYTSNLTSGILEGYQTFDAIGGVLVGGVLVISLSLKGISKEESKGVIAKAGLFAGLGFVIMYVGLIALGAANSGTLEISNRTELLSQLSYNTLGSIGRSALGVLVALACFTTAVGIVTGTADFFKGLFKDSHKAYVITAVISCILGVGMGQLDVHSIIVVALPALMFIYPITIVLILLNVIPDKFATPLVFRWVVAITILFSLPDFLASIGLSEITKPIQEFLPFGTVTLGWLLPALVTFIVVNLFTLKRDVDNN
ncbi:branched-chain amino acid transport system II carrier protein [uncultured Dokdonia sp.]|uniref:branched-chain amino acid transport system II carrier protein n=1 Tax=uncultured Dokdonia sp. TaxID=575653 RepID=UPI00261A80EB|nr:branched-chain amino acid transport system II carrier protein [uncultured Dokdonia sp.]